MRSLTKCMSENDQEAEKIINEEHDDNDELFGEPAWDILLDLYIANVENKPVSVSSACIGSAAPPTTGSCGRQRRACDSCPKPLSGCPGQGAAIAEAGRLDGLDSRTNRLPRLLLSSGRSPASRSNHVMNECSMPKRVPPPSPKATGADVRRHAYIYFVLWLLFVLLF